MLLLASRVQARSKLLLEQSSLLRQEVEGRAEVLYQARSGVSTR